MIGARGVVSVLATAAVAGVAWASLLPPSGARAADEVKRFTLVYNVNNSGYVDVCGCKHKEVRQGSLTRRASFLKQLRATGRPILLLDGGSTLFHIENRVKEAEHAEAVRKARLIVDAYNYMGYQAMAVGAFELAAGMDELLDLAKRAKFPFLSANLANRKTGELYFKPHTILEAGGVRVGVIGLTLDSLTRPYLDEVAPDAELRDPVAAVRKSAAELRDKTDLIIALSHLREETNFEIAKEVPEIRFIVDPFIQYGNPHTWIKDFEWLYPKEGSWLLRSDGQGARMGVVDLEFTSRHPQLVSADYVEELKWLVENGEASDEDKEQLKTLGSNPNRFWFTRVSLEPHHLSDPEIDRLVEAWKKNIDPSAVTAELTGKDDFVTHDRCESCHREQYAFWKKTKHAGAWDALVETGDQHRFDCVGCHSLGYGLAFLDTSKAGNYAGVQCESCHGHVSGHLENPAEHKYGRVERLTCLTCHNEEQTKAEFVYTRAKPLVACPRMSDKRASGAASATEPSSSGAPKLLPVPEKPKP